MVCLHTLSLNCAWGSGDPILAKVVILVILSILSSLLSLPTLSSFSPTNLLLPLLRPFSLTSAKSNLMDKVYADHIIDAVLVEGGNMVRATDTNGKSIAGLFTAYKTSVNQHLFGLVILASQNWLMTTFLEILVLTPKRSACVCWLDSLCQVLLHCKRRISCPLLGRFFLWGRCSCLSCTTQHGRSDGLCCQDTHPMYECILLCGNT